MSTHFNPDTRTQDQLLDDLYESSSSLERDRILERLSATGQADALDEIVHFIRENPEAAGKSGLNALRVLSNKFTPADRYGLAESLIPFLERKDWSQRLTATRLLNTHPNELATAPLRDLVTEAYDILHQEAKNKFSPKRLLAERLLNESVMAMANCGRLSVLPEILDYTEEPVTRPIAARALGIIGDETEREYLEDLAEDPDVRVRDSAQWALGLMDDRREMFMNPPMELPEPPPERLHPVYWAHRQLNASKDALVQFMVIRVALEHLLLDRYLGDGRIPEGCTIILRQYIGDTPPDFRSQADDAKIIEAWRYTWEGPTLTALEELPEKPQSPQPKYKMQRTEKKTGWWPAIMISYPTGLQYAQSGFVSFDSLLEAHNGRGWLYYINHDGEDWQFSRVKSVWSF